MFDPEKKEELEKLRDELFGKDEISLEDFAELILPNIIVEEAEGGAFKVLIKDNPETKKEE